MKMARKLLLALTSSLVLSAAQAMQPEQEAFWSRALGGVALQERESPRKAAAAASLVRHADGRVHYIVDLEDDAPRRFRDEAAPADAFQSHHKVEVRHLVQELKRTYAFEPTTITSWAAVSFSAYLTDTQVERLKTDTRVIRITPNRRLEFSAAWSNTVNGAETTPWGVHAVGAASPAGGGGVTVYVLDSGVDGHPDLLNVVSRENAQPRHPAVGCYGHGTHVAGIIGAASDGNGVRGVYPGVPIVSIAATESGAENCMRPTMNGIQAGLDLIKARIHQAGRIGVVNLSMNGLFNGWIVGTALGDRVQSLITPAGDYPGAFVAQSAGNNFADACPYVYGPGSGSDGLVAVGAMDRNGQRVYNLNGAADAFHSDPGLAGAEPGSNFGDCVDLWAPGQQVYSTWLGGGFANLSGTSMAAPHVAAMAAYLIDYHGLATPQEVEAAVRGTVRELGESTIGIPNLFGMGAPAYPTVEFRDHRNRLGGVFPDEYQNVMVSLRYEALGARANGCLFRIYLDGSLVNTFLLDTAFQFPPMFLGTGQYRFTVTCENNAGRFTEAEAHMRILRGVTAVNWFVSASSTGNQMTHIPAGGTFSWQPGESFTAAFSGTNADYCSVEMHGEGCVNMVCFPRSDLLWSSGPLPPDHNFGPLFLPTANEFGYARYQFTATCGNYNGAQPASAQILAN